MQTETIGIIGGSGWLGGAIAQALLETSFITEDRLCLSNRSGAYSQAAAGVRLFKDNQLLVDASSIVILAVRPEQFDSLNINAVGKLVISLMAGVSAAKISSATGSTLIVRAMANAAVQIRRSFTPWHCAEVLPSEKVELVQALFERVGTAARVPAEDCIDYLSALSGTGPAFPALLLTALASQAAAAGIPEDVAMMAARGVVLDASRLLDAGDPQGMIDSLVGYRGVTAAALQTLMDKDFAATVGEALLAGAAVARRGM
jgi:pyrroline-5-carboxylate reductase